MTAVSRSHAGLPSRISAIVFDCGDTLLELVPGKVEICGQVLEGLGHPMPAERVRLAYRIADVQLKQRSSLVDTAEKKRAFYTEFNGLLARALGIESASAPFDRALQEAFGAKRHWTLVAGAREALQILDGKTSLFVLANWDTRLREHLERNRIAHHFQGCFASQELGVEKPDLRAFAEFAERSGVVPAQALYVGNEYDADVVGSRRAGFTPVLLDREGLFGEEVDCFYFTSWNALVMKLDPALG